MAYPTSAKEILVPRDFIRIQDAIAYASNDDVIVVSPGSYCENIDFMGKDVRLVSEMGAQSTIIDGCRLGSVVTFKNGELYSSVIEGFTLKNGSGTYDSYWNDYYGAGIFCENNSSPKIVGNIVTSNWADGGYNRGKGGGIYCNCSSPIIVENVICDNYAFNGGGVYCYDSFAIVRNNIIKNNRGNNGGGGGICIQAM